MRMLTVPSAASMHTPSSAAPSVEYFAAFSSSSWVASASRLAASSLVTFR